MTESLAAVRRSAQVSWAFLKLGVSTALKYPLGFATQQIGVIVPVLIYFFLAGFVDRDGPEVAGDYFTFVMVGLVGMQTLNAGLRALSSEIDQAVTRGWFEMILVEPVPWPLLPFVMSEWPIVNAMFAASVVSGVALLLGAAIVPSGIPIALAVGLLGILVGLAIGSLAAGVKVLAKRGDPVLTFYSLSALILSGVYFPLDALPEPLQALSTVFVHTYVISGLRHALLPAGDSLSGPTAGEAVVVLSILAVVLVPLSLWVFSRSMEYGRRMGLLSGY